MNNCQCGTNTMVAFGARLALGIVFLIMGLVKLGTFATFVNYLQVDLFGAVGWVQPLIVLLAGVMLLAEIIIGLSLVIGLRPVHMLFTLILYVTFVNIWLLIGSDYISVGVNTAYIILAILTLMAMGCCCPSRETTRTFSSQREEPMMHTDVFSDDADIFETVKTTSTRRPAKKAGRPRKSASRKKAPTRKKAAKKKSRR